MRLRALVVIGLLAFASLGATVQSASAASSGPDFGPNVHIFSPSMAQTTIQSELNEIAVAQVHNQFGTRRDAVLFEPGTYGSVHHPLVFQVGYYTSVAGLGLSPNDVHIVGAIEVPNQCNDNTTGTCFALVNFWRSVSNLTIDVNTAGADLLPMAATAPEKPDCVGSNELWAVSQASPMRRVVIDNNRPLFLFDYCGGPGYASGGYIADSSPGFVINAPQQQWLTRNSTITGWSNGVWNQVFMGVLGAPTEDFANPKGNHYTTLPTSPVTREAPYLYQDANGAYNVFVPSVQHNTSGTSWSAGPTPGRSIPIQDFFIATPADRAPRITSELASGKNLILTPGVYHLDQAIEVTHPDTVVLGLGFPTLVPDHGKAAIRALNARGVIFSGLLFDAGAERSDVLLQVGNGNDAGDASDPALLADVFFRIGGAAVGKVSTALIVNSGNVILDDIWAWRADHGTGVGWTSNTADTGVVVNGDNVTAYGLFVEHFQKTEVVWNGNNGRDVFFQNELPYDPPDQASWMASPTQDGYPAFEVAPNVTTFNGYGMGSYVVFIQTTATLFDAEAFQSPTSTNVRFHDVLTVWIAGSGGDLSVINGVGGPDTSTTPGKVEPVTVVNYP